jgi:hypothetical protein
LINRAQGKKPGRGSTIVSALLTLAGGLALKWSIVHAGHDSALDGEANRRVTRATERDQGWGTQVRAVEMPPPGSQQRLAAD